MPEWVRDDAGAPLKVSDALLDKISELMKERDQLRKDLFTAVEAALSDER